MRGHLRWQFSGRKAKLATSFAVVVMNVLATATHVHRRTLLDLLSTCLHRHLDREVCNLSFPTWAYRSVTRI